MKFYIEIECGNDAFVDDWKAEVKDMLVKAAHKLNDLDDNMADGRKLMDVNGNSCGKIWTRR